MSKRFIFPQQHGERKKSKLDISISDHNFPLSQDKDEGDNWGDDNDDEILLLASQACEQAFTSNDISTLPDYSLCMQPATTSTQMCDIPRPSTSKSPFIFKKPSTLSLSSATNTTNLKDKCNRISSPLPGMLSKVSKSNDKFTSDLSFNDKIYKDSDQIYRQLLQLQEENAKLKSENGKLQEKYVTKEGESSILRTQLKTCQIAVDNARMEKVRAQEHLQMEWTEKLSNANGQIHDLRNQLDFKNLEIISTKERCKMLESSKVKLTQVTVANDINNSHRISTSFTDISSQRKRLRTCNNSAQTIKNHFMEISKTTHTVPSKLTPVLPLILEASNNHELPLLIYNEKLQKYTDFSQNKCRIYSTFYRMPSTVVQNKDEQNKITNLNSVYEDLTSIGSKGGNAEMYMHIFSVAKQILSQTVTELETISTKSSTAFQKEMDEKYINTTNSFTEIKKQDLLTSRSLFIEEQALLSRRVTAILVYIVDSHETMCIFRHFEEKNNNIDTQNIGNLIDIITRICKLLESNLCALLYSGLLLSITYILQKVIKHTKEMNNKILNILKYILISRPLYIVSCKVLKVLRKMSLDAGFMNNLCLGGSMGNLKLDYDQGVLLYRKDSCYLQVLLKQIESSLHCIEKQQLVKLAVNITRDSIALFTNINGDCAILPQDKTRCDCRLILMQVIVYSLRICACMLEHNTDYEASLLSNCRSGLTLLYQCCNDVEFISTLAYNEGHYIEFCEIIAKTLKKYPHDEVYSNMLIELMSMFSSSPSDEEQTSHDSAWFNSFTHFSITD